LKKPSLNNLVWNALEACHKGLKTNSMVVVRADFYDKRHFMFEIEDNANGMEETTKQNLFKEFFSTKGTAGTGLGTDPNSKVIVTTVEEAITLGADAVSIHVNLGADTEPEMICNAGEISRKCQQWGMPLLAMVYPRGKNIKDPFDVDALKTCARVAAELGADIVKTSYTGDIDTFREVVRGAQIPVVIAGGPKMGSDMEMLQMVRDSLDAGGKGVSIFLPTTSPNFTIIPSISSKISSCFESSANMRWRS